MKFLENWTLKHLTLFPLKRNNRSKCSHICIVWLLTTWWWELVVLLQKKNQWCSFLFKKTIWSLIAKLSQVFFNISCAYFVISSFHISGRTLWKLRKKGGRLFMWWIGRSSFNNTNNIQDIYSFLLKQELSACCLFYYDDHDAPSKSNSCHIQLEPLTQ